MAASRQHGLPQCRGWRCGAPDGGTGPEVTEGMRPASLTSWRHPFKGHVEGTPRPRARRGVSWCGARPSSEIEVHPSGIGVAVWWATEVFWAVGFICFRAAAGAGRD
jgi:hypothetical protein